MAMSCTHGCGGVACAPPPVQEGDDGYDFVCAGRATPSVAHAQAHAEIMAEVDELHDSFARMRPHRPPPVKIFPPPRAHVERNDDDDDVHRPLRSVPGAAPPSPSMSLGRRPESVASVASSCTMFDSLAVSPGSSPRTPDFRETAPLRPNPRRDARRDTLEKPPLPPFLPPQPPPPHFPPPPRPPPLQLPAPLPPLVPPVAQRQPQARPWKPRPLILPAAISAISPVATSPASGASPSTLSPLARHRRSLCRPLPLPLALASRHMGGEDGVLSPVVGTNETRSSAGPGRGDGQSIIWSPHSPRMSSSFARVRHGLPPPYHSLEHTYQGPAESPA